MLLEPLIVLFVKVSVDVSVTIEPSVVKVISLPDTEVVIPEPPVNNIPPPNEIVWAELSSPVIDIDELVSEELPMFDNVFVEPLILLLVKTSDVEAVTNAETPDNKFNSVGVDVNVIDVPLPMAP